jgi:hypothetical protein
MLKIFLWVIVIGFVLRVILVYILPIFRIGSVAAKQMRHMQQQMQDMENQMSSGGGGRQQTQPGTKPVRPADDDYIEYEELR